MRILVITHAQFGLNACSRHLERATSLATRGHEVSFVCTSPTNRFRVGRRVERGVRILQSPDLLWGRLRQGLDPWNTLVRTLILLLWRGDLVHCIDSRPAAVLPSLAAKYLRGRRLVMEWTDLFGRGGTIRERSSRLYEITAGRVEVFFEERFRRCADGAFTISSYLRDILLSLGYPAERIEVMPLGTDPGRVIRTPKSAARSALGLDPAEVYLTYVGAIFPRDAQLLMDAFQALRERRGGGLRLVLVGKHGWAGHLNGRCGVTVTGFVGDKELQLYLAASDVLLLPLVETVANMARFPSKLCDYVLAGRPIVATAVSDIPALFERYHLGVLAASATADGFRSAIEQVLSAPDLWEAYGAEAHRCAREWLALDVLGARIEQFYSRISALGHG